MFCTPSKSSATYLRPWSARSPPSPRNWRENWSVHSKILRKLHRLTFCILQQLSQTITHLFVGEKTGENRWYLHVMALQPAMFTCACPPSWFENHLFTDLYWITLMIHGLSSQIISHFPSAYKIALFNFNLKKYEITK